MSGRARSANGVVRAPALATVAALALFVFTGAASAESPRNASPPTITGTPAVGATLTGHNGAWLDLDGSACGPECSHTFQWQRCDAGGSCADIAGASGQTYLVSAADRGRSLRVVGTATKWDCNARGEDCRWVSPTAASAATAAVAGRGSGAGPPGGIQVGPPLPPPPSATGAEVETGGKRDPAFWDIPGRIKAAIDDWFRGLVEDALNPALDLIGRTILATPQLAGNERVGELWLMSLGIADALLVLVLLCAGALLMTHETLQSRYALKDVLPRITFAAVAANASLAVCGQMIEVANALSGGFLSGGVDPAEASLRLKQFAVAAVASGGIFLVLVGLVCAVFAVVLLLLYIVRAAIVVLLVCAAPLFLLAHALPQTDGLARLWWRGMAAALGVQVAQAFVLATAVRVFFSPDGRGVLGLGASGSLIDLLVVLCLLWLLVKIPFWAKDLAFSGRQPALVQAARTYVVARAGKAALS
jgi:hypothetical protein